MAEAKRRTPVPTGTAAKALFLSDRTCCVCREPGKPVQLHHIDGDPSNHEDSNLAVLCLDCHNETQVRGGFGRALDADQVTLYRSNWLEIVAMSRARTDALEQPSLQTGTDINVLTSVAEAYRDNEEWSLLAAYYDAMGNHDLRDKYIERALAGEPSDYAVIHLRAMQSRQQLIPDDVVEREADRYTSNEDWSQRARFHREIRRPVEAVLDYARTIVEGLEDDRVFSAAYYLRELSDSRLHEELYLIAFEQARAKGDLWWQVRALEDLGWTEELHALVLEHADEIETSGHAMLMLLLARARGDNKAAAELEKSLAQGTRTVRYDGSHDDLVWIGEQSSDDDESAPPAQSAGSPT